MGGTFMSMAEDYRDYFIRSLHDALSGHSSSSVDEAVRYARGDDAQRDCRTWTSHTGCLVGGGGAWALAWGGDGRGVCLVFVCLFACVFVCLFVCVCVCGGGGG
jgi:hypothetical protein